MSAPLVLTVAAMSLVVGCASFSPSERAAQPTLDAATETGAAVDAADVVDAEPAPSWGSCPALHWETSRAQYRGDELLSHADHYMSTDRLFGTRSGHVFYYGYVDYDPRADTYRFLPDLADHYTSWPFLGHTGGGIATAMMADGHTAIFIGGATTADAPSNVESMDVESGARKFIARTLRLVSNPWAFTLPDGRVLVATRFDGPATAQSELYDPAVDQWTDIETPAEFTNAVGDWADFVQTKNGDVFAFGPHVSWGGRTWKLDLATMSWVRLADMPLPIAESSSVELADGRILLAGGLDCADNIYHPSNQVRIFDPRSNTWRVGADLPEPTIGASLHTLACGQVLSIGGCTNGGFDDDCWSSADLYDVEHDEWHAAPLPTPPLLTRGVGFRDLPDGRILVAFGALTSEAAAREAAVPLFLVGD